MYKLITQPRLLRHGERLLPGHKVKQFEPVVRSGQLQLRACLRKCVSKPSFLEKGDAQNMQFGGIAQGCFSKAGHSTSCSDVSRLGEA